MEHVLVVEDSPEISALINLTLRIEGYEVSLASDGGQAFDMASSLIPDLILMDVMMPGMNGFQVAAKLKEREATRHIPLIFVTAKSELPDMVHGLETAVDYISKPFAVPELVARVRAALRMKKLQSELQQSNEELSRLALTDGLTGLLNRRGFDQQLEDEIWRARRFGHGLGLLIFDLDRFKTVNDTWGHTQGDVVLRAFSEVLMNSSRRVDKVARFGGEEFALLLPATDADGVEFVGEKVREATEKMRIECGPDGEPVLRVTVSAGGVIFPELAENGPPVSDLAHGMFDLADRCLYAAKNSGRNRVITRSATDEEAAQAVENAPATMSPVVHNKSSVGFSVSSNVAAVSRWKDIDPQLRRRKLCNSSHVCNSRHV